MKNIEITENKEIGIVTLNYDRDGHFLTSEFTPTIGLIMDDKAMAEFMQTDCQNSEDVIKSQAEAVFATWFQSLNDIELADREKYIIVTEPAAPCERYDNDIIKSVTLRVVFKPL